MKRYEVSRYGWFLRLGSESPSDMNKRMPRPLVWDGSCWVGHPATALALAFWIEGEVDEWSRWLAGRKWSLAKENMLSRVAALRAVAAILRAD